MVRVSALSVYRYALCGVFLVIAFGFTDPSTAVAQSIDLNARTFDRCWRVIRDRFYDPEHGNLDWDEVGRRYRPEALDAESRPELRKVLQTMIAELGVSHAAILDGDAYRSMRAELSNKRLLTYGVLLEETQPGFFYIRDLYEGGPGERAGLGVGDRVVLVNGLAPDRSDAVVDAGYDPGLPGPPMHFFRARRGEGLRLLIQPRSDEQSRRMVRVQPDRMNAVDATRNSVREIERGNVRIGTLHIWFCSRGVGGLLSDAIARRFDDCDGLVIDLRGRGGSPEVIHELLGCFYAGKGSFGEPLPALWSRPVVFLVDRRSRSAKEVMAFLIKADELGRVVGERTEGAVLGASFFPLPDGSYLEVPVVEFPVRGVRLEGRGVEPHHPVTMDIPFLGGRDPIFEEGLRVLENILNGTATPERTY